MKGLLLFKRDVVEGIWRKKWLFLFAPLLVWISCLELEQKWHEIKSFHQIKGDVTYMDYWIFLIQGKEPYEFSLNKLYEFPITWLVFFAFLLVAVNAYPAIDLKGWGIQVIVRSKSRWNWWLPKCGWCAACVVLYFLLALLTVMLFSLASGSGLSLKPSWYVMNQLGKDEYLTLSTIGRIVLLLVQPFLLAVLLGVLQMGLALLVHPMFAFCAVFSLTLVSTYCRSYFLCGNWGMPYRMSSIVSGGLDNRVCMALLLVTIGVCIVACGFLFTKKDIYESNLR